MPIVTLHYIQKGWSMRTGYGNHYRRFHSNGYWYFQLSGLASKLKGQFIKVMEPLKWKLSPTQASAFRHPTLIFCYCQMSKPETTDLAKKMADDRKFPMELTTGIVNVLDELGFSIFKCSDVRMNGVDTFQTQQIWTLSSNNKLL